MLIGRDGHNPTLKKISKWEFKWVVGLSLGFSALVNIGHIFQYKLNSGGFYLPNNYYLYIDLAYPSIIEETLSVSVYFLLYVIVDYIGFFIINTLVEVTMVKKLHFELEEKRKRLEKMDENENGSHKNTSTDPISFRKRRKHEIEEKTEQRAILMVVINALINFFFRLPELFFIYSVSCQFFGLSFWTDILRSFQNLSQLTVDLTYFFYILTFSTNFLIYYLFNLKFKQTFADWTHVKIRV
jgi:hypothetical protein